MNGPPASSAMFDSDGRRRLMDLVDASLRGELAESEQQQLDAMLVANPSARDCFRDYVLDCAVLREWAAQPDGVTPRFNLASLGQVGGVSPSEIERSKSLAIRPIERRLWQALHWRTHPYRFSAVVALLTAVIWSSFFAFTISHWRPAPLAASPAPASANPLVATVAKLDAAQFTAPDKRLAPGDLLEQGAVIELSAGLLELRFHGGAGLLVEGPATLRVDSADDCFLQGGKVCATVPARARGFTIRSELVDLVDLGTAFGVEILSSRLYTSVFTGSIEVQRRSTSAGAIVATQILTAGQAAEMEANGPLRVLVDAQPERFTREIPRGDAEHGLIAHYPLDETSPGEVAEQVSGRAAKNRGAQVNAPGAAGGAYQFDGQSSYLDTERTDLIPAHDDFSFFCWIQTESTVEAGQYLINNYRVGEPGRMALGVRKGKLHLFVDGTRVEAFGGFVADGRWQHVGVSRQDGNFYLWQNGVGKRIPAAAAVPIGERSPWLIGKRSEDNARSFLGRIDDVRIYDRLLLPEDVEAVMRLATTASLVPDNRLEQEVVAP